MHEAATLWLEIYFEEHDRTLRGVAFDSSFAWRVNKAAGTQSAGGSTTLAKLTTGTQALTMVLKQCHTRLKSFALTNPEKWYDPSHNQDKVSFISWLPANVCPKAVNVSAGLNIPPDSNCGKQLWRRGQVAGPKVMHLPAVTRLFVRGNTTPMLSLKCF